MAEELARRASLALDNAQLYEVAQRAIRARDQVLGVVAHDLRSPLGTILMQGQLLRRPDGSPERTTRRAADIIERGACRMNRLIQDLLDVTRMENGRLVIEQASLGTKPLLLEAVESQKTLAAAGALALELDLEDDLPDVWGDRDRLLQVLENLVGNAAKFTGPEGSITLGARARGREVLFWVKDTGSGIEEGDLPHVFERFWQAKDAPVSRGAGLGLPIAKGIVEAHGGRIWVESARGRGTTLFFTIPTADACDPAPRLEARAPGP
jgi:signal transduction histidine kinase